MAEPAPRVAFAFPGAGIDLCGAEREIVRRHRDAFRPFLEAASARAATDFAAALEEERVDAVPDRQKQYFTYAFAAAYADLLRRRGVAPVAVAGYSFGVYAALHAAGAVDFERGIDILERAYEVMAEETRGRDCGMGIIVGLAEREISEILRAPFAAEIVHANSNNDTCHILAGPRAALEEALGAARAREAFTARPLPVDIPYHHPGLLGRAGERLAAHLALAPLAKPRCPIVSTIDQRPLSSPDEIAAFVAANIAQPIRWVRVVPALAALGAAAIVECGPGISLAQNARFMDGAPPHVTLRNAAARLGI